MYFTPLNWMLKNGEKGTFYIMCILQLKKINALKNVQRRRI